LESIYYLFFRSSKEYLKNSKYFVVNKYFAVDVSKIRREVKKNKKGNAQQNSLLLLCFQVSRVQDAKKEKEEETWQRCSKEF